MEAQKEISGDDPEKIISRLNEAKDKIFSEMGKVIVGQQEVITDLLIALLSRGHCLVVGVPGLAKTLMIRTLAAILDLKFKRIQFTPDLMPSDITGTDVLEEDPITRKRTYKFITGPIFSNILLADEINRTPPKTQAALLEAMQEYRVTAGGVPYPLDPPFFVLATQNPIEQEGTYPLPEAQLDRFMFNIKISYPTFEDEIKIVKTTTAGDPPELDVVLSSKEILYLQDLVRKIPVSDFVISYATRLVRASRPIKDNPYPFINKYVTWGSGPRAAQCLILGAKARAILSGTVNVACEDVRSVAEIVLRHRIFLNFNAGADGISSDTIIQRLVNTVPEEDKSI